ncbi:hypothetical protein RM572_27065 [Streptomyces sp. DSM 42041]|uniref:Uncharacterized protein n=1 Tax=Streptomyces hazeniae TaxID=3075538 RepID=A0ABU2NZL2_9ACTN|nr:hypothetical protein [Streptomyces sp. DSM 42041]MDT0382424.1 hypothetical protein [Streptomyces sp. DSM 42041]
MPSFVNDPRYVRLVDVLVPLLRRSCPEAGGGYGGSYELRLTAKEATELGGVALIRSAMRKAARSLGWDRLQTYGGEYPSVTVAGVTDRRDIPESFADVVEAARLERGRAAMEVFSRTMTDGTRRAVPGSVFVTTQEFLAAYADA